MTSPEFIFLNGQAARVTSLKPSDETGGFSLVVIARGGADRDQLLELLKAEDLTVRLDQDPERAMRTTGVEIRSVGEGPRANHRIQAVLVPLDGSLTEPPASTEAPDDDRTSIEQRLDRIIELLTEIRDRT
jgi:hypothetical protein